MARPMMMPAMWRLNSAGPRLSPVGLMAATAAVTAAFTAAASPVVPTSAAPAAAEKIGVSARFVIATAADDTLPPVLVSCTAQAAVA